MGFICVFFLFPILSAILGALEQVVTKNIFAIGLFNLVLWLLLSFTVFNRTFLIWAILNTIIGTFSAYVVKKWH